MLVNYKKLNGKNRRKPNHANIEILNKRARLIFEQSPFAIQIFNKEGECVEANTAWEKIFDTEMSNLIGYNILKDPQVKSTGILPCVQKAFDGETSECPVILYDPAISKKPGKAIWLRTILYPILDSQNKVAEIVLFIENFSSQKEAEENLKEKNAELERVVNIMVGRELKIIELKKELTKLKSKMGYKTDSKN